ncbi:HNH endonuclease [Sporosarcina phage Lietuvens]|nr:HNH endonuclease [Sporosarcina phage Lietuvens]
MTRFKMDVDGEYAYITEHPSGEYYIESTQKGRIFYRTRLEYAAAECMECRRVKVLKHFRKHSKMTAEVSSKCRECLSRIAKKNADATAMYKREYYLANKKALGEQHSEYYRQNRGYLKEKARVYRSENIEDVRKRGEEYRKNNRPKLRKYYLDNREYLLRKAKESRIKNPESSVVAHQLRRARELRLPNTLTKEQYADTMKHFGGCALTKETENLHMDHVIPISVGHGGTTIDNVIPLKRELNLSKSNSNIFEWFELNKGIYNLNDEAFNEAVGWLSKQLGISNGKYKDYVYWCHANPIPIQTEEGHCV